MVYSVSKKELRNKRRQAYMKLVLPTTLGFLNGVIPKPTAEVPGEIVSMVADMAIFADIWGLYFDDISIDDIQLVLQEVGILKSAGTVATFASIRIADGVINEIGNFGGPVGWIVEGILSGSISVVAGYMWIRFCEKIYLKHGPDITKEVLGQEAIEFDLEQEGATVTA